MEKTYRLDNFDGEVQLGKFSQQADGAVWFKQGGTVILATVVSARSQDFPGFFPLTVEYREQLSAAGKIPGGYYKREGKPSEQEVLTARLIDRAMRPLFPADFFDQVQIIVTVYSVDKEHAPSIIALIASSLAVSISKIPFLAPVAAVEAIRIDGAWVMNPKYQDALRGDARVVVAGTDEGVSMVEGCTNQISEQEFIDVLFKAHAEIKNVVAWQARIQNEWGTAKEQQPYPYDFAGWRAKIETFLNGDRVMSICSAKEGGNESSKRVGELKEEFLQEQKAHLTESETPKSVADYLFETVLKDKVTDAMFAMNKRMDGRSFDKIRPISIDVGLLPFTHGSALFNRGDTQALVTATLGDGQDEQRTERLMGDEGKDGSFMLHYNFPPFSVGEARPMRGTGRREIGHGNLAASALFYVRPSKESFPYTIRVVADILSSDGSTSMATTCGATMALMQGGVPITNMVSGIAMGLVMDKTGNFKVLSDMTGFEDAFGLMDFKVTGTDKGITAIQMDIKYKGGFSRNLFETALEQARVGRLFILGKMREVMSKPNADLSLLVPRVTTLKISTDKIGAVIGSGGKTIREIIEVTGTSIDIEPDGMVKIFGTPEAKTDVAIRWVKTLAGQITSGEIFEGKIKRIADFGLFVEMVPGVQGLMHVSNIPREQQRSFMRDYKVDDVVRAQILEYDEVTGRISLKLVVS